MTKKCSKCKKMKTLDMFHRASREKDGHRSICKECRKEQQESKSHKRKEYLKEYRESNKEILKEKSKEYFKKNKERMLAQSKMYRLSHQEEIKQYRKDYRLKNKEKLNKQSREYYIENREYLLEKNKQWSLNNREYLNAYERAYKKTNKGRIVRANTRHKRREIIKNSSLSSSKLEDIINNATHCYWCGTPLKGKKSHIDHYIPLSMGGLHEENNIVISCAKCNMKKNKKDPLEFANSIGKLL